MGDLQGCGLWPGQALAFLLPPCTCLVGVNKPVIVWRCAAHTGIGVSLCVGSRKHSPGPKEQRCLSRLGGLQRPRLEAGCLLEDELLQPLLG